MLADHLKNECDAQEQKRNKDKLVAGAAVLTNKTEKLTWRYYYGYGRTSAIYENGYCIKFY